MGWMCTGNLDYTVIPVSMAEWIERACPAQDSRLEPGMEYGSLIFLAHLFTFCEGIQGKEH